MATTNSEAWGWRSGRPRSSNLRGMAFQVRMGCGCLSLFSLLTLTLPGFSENASRFAQRAEKHFHEAQKKLQTNTNDSVAGWQFGRACFDWADFAKSPDQRGSIAVEGIAACRQVIARNSKLAPGHYYLAMNLGRLAQTKTLGALKIVDEMEREFKTARELDAKFDFAGPDRNLGLLYFEAPGWPASIGSKAKARQHLQRAAQLAPVYPENQLCLLEAYSKWGDKKSFVRGLEIAEELLPRARKELTGEDWEQGWADWDKRWKRIREKSAELK